jgi:hypothetical protein
MLCQECFFFDNGCSLYPMLPIKADMDWTEYCKHQRGKINGKNWEEVEKESSQKQRSLSIAPF